MKPTPFIDWFFNPHKASGIVLLYPIYLTLSDVTLQVGALITMGCVLSIDTKKGEVLRSVEKDTAPLNINISQPTLLKSDSDCEDFEEGYSDDEMFTAIESDKCIEVKDVNYFRSWILDICFKNMGWIFRANEVNVSNGLR